MERLNKMYETVLAIKNLLENLCERAIPALGKAAHPPPDVEAGIVNDELWDAVQVMDYLRISRSTYFRYVQQGILVPRIVGRRHYYRKIDLQNGLDLGGRKGRF